MFHANGVNETAYGGKYPLEGEVGGAGLFGGEAQRGPKVPPVDVMVRRC